MFRPQGHQNWRYYPRKHTQLVYIRCEGFHDWLKKKIRKWEYTYTHSRLSKHLYLPAWVAGTASFATSLTACKASAQMPRSPTGSSCELLYIKANLAHFRTQNNGHEE